MNCFGASRLTEAFIISSGARSESVLSLPGLQVGTGLDRVGDAVACGVEAKTQRACGRIENGLKLAIDRVAVRIEIEGIGYQETGISIKVGAQR